MNLGMYIMATEPISTAYVINPFHQSVCLYVYPSYQCKAKCIPPFIARQRLSKHVPAATNTHKSRRTVGRACLWVCLCIPLSLLGNNSVKKFPQQRRIVGGIIFYVGRVISNESRRLVLPKTSCLFMVYLTTWKYFRLPNIK
jgi:hypothetical protein